MDFWRMMEGGMPVIACWMGLDRLCPTGMPKYACWIFPAIFETFYVKCFVVLGLI